MHSVGFYDVVPRAESSFRLFCDCSHVTHFTQQTRYVACAPTQHFHRSIWHFQEQQSQHVSTIRIEKRGETMRRHIRRTVDTRELRCILCVFFVLRLVIVNLRVLFVMIYVWLDDSKWLIFDINYSLWLAGVFSVLITSFREWGGCLRERERAKNEAVVFQNWVNFHVD